MFLSSYHHEIFKSYYQWQKWCPWERSKSEVKGQGHRGQNPTQPFPDHNITMSRPRALIQVCSTPICMVQCTYLITTGGIPHLYNRGSSMLHLSAEIFISTGEWGVQMPPLTSENSHFLRSGPQEATLVMTPVWIHIWWWNDAQSLMLLRTQTLGNGRGTGRSKVSFGRVC